MNTVIAVLFLAFASVQVFADIDTSRKSRIVKGAYIIEFKSTFTRRFKINQVSEFSSRRIKWKNIFLRFSLVSFIVE